MIIAANMVQRDFKSSAHCTCVGRQQDDAVVLNSVSLVCQSLPDNAVYLFSVSHVTVLYNNNVKWTTKISGLLPVHQN